MSNDELQLAIDTVWVIVAACMVFLMQAGLRDARGGLLARQERRRRGREDPRQPRRSARSRSGPSASGFAFGNGNEVFGTRWLLPLGLRLRVAVLLGRAALRQVPVRGRLLHRQPRDRVGHDARPHQVRRLRRVRARVRRPCIYPLVGHWIWGGGFLADLGMQDFAGSTVVHLCGATAALAGTLLLGARIGKFDRKGKAHPIPGHSMPLAVLGVLILWFGWFGFNPGSTLGGGRRALRRHRRDHEPGCRRRRARRDHRRLHRSSGRSTSASPATARSPASSPSPRRARTWTTGRRA